MKLPDKGHVEDRILAYLAGELAETEALQVRDHLRTCDSCRSVSRELGALSRTLESDVTPDPPPLWPGVQARIRRPARTPHRLRWVTSTALAAVAGVILGLLAGSHPPTAGNDSGYPLWSAVGSSLTGDQSIASDAYGESILEGARK